MSEFQTFLTLGFDHIADINAYDHILFIVALCAVYRVNQWRHILILVTAFTIGHSLTLALATLGVLLVRTDIVEFLIPITIILTAMFNVFEKPEHLTHSGKIRRNYFLALFFGLIHGMGFSSYLRALLGDEESILLPLFSFNVGLELGQLMIVAFIVLAAYLALNLAKWQHREWNLFISGAAAGIALILLLESDFWRQLIH